MLSEALAFFFDSQFLLSQEQFSIPKHSSSNVRTLMKIVLLSFSLLLAMVVVGLSVTSFDLFSTTNERNDETKTSPTDSPDDSSSCADCSCESNATPPSDADGNCSGDCSACSEGDSTNCQCSDEGAATKTDTESCCDQADSSNEGFQGVRENHKPPKK